MFNVRLPASSRTQLRVSSVVKVLSYERPQLDVQEHDQVNGAASNGVGGTPGSVVGSLPQRGPLRLNAPQEPL